MKPHPEATPVAVKEEVSPTLQPAPGVPAAAERVSPTPTARPLATVRASAEGPAQEASPPGTVPQSYVPQPLPLHPFRPAGGRARVIALDPGHGGPEVGAAGAGVAEKNVNLSIALRLQKLLEEDGMKVVLTRDRDRRAFALPEDNAPAGYSNTRADLQARIDLANRAQADVFISIHNNGSADPNQSGTEVWWDGKRPFAAFNGALAEESSPP